MGFKRAAALTMPAFGVVKGGSLDGWRYHFLAFVPKPDGLKVLARCSRPNWPFPSDIELDHTHFTSLRAVVGERARRWPALPMIESAYTRLGMPVPWFMTEAKGTLRARVKQSSRPSARRAPSSAAHH